MFRQAPLIGALALLLLTADRGRAGDGAPPCRAASPFGIHGPTYSHWLAAGRPHLWQEGEAHLAVLADSGAGWARQDFWWSLAEPEQGRLVWDDFDRAVAAYERHGICLLGILCYASAWSGGAAPATDDERARFADYVRRIVGRYAGRVAAWEIWNEPNIQPFWSPRPDPELYAKLLRAAYVAAKQADPDCIIVGGALAGPDAAFLRGMYAAGAKGHFDVLSYHNYGQHMELATEWPELRKLRAVMAESADGDRPIWHTETGFYTGPAGLSEPAQAARIVRYSVGLLALGIERTFQLTLADWTDDPRHHDLSVFRGLTRADYRPKPALAAYRTMCQRLGDRRFVAALRPAAGVSGYLFEGGGRSVVVLWREGAEAAAPAGLDLGTPVALVQQLGGDWQVLREDSGRYTLPVGSDPLYVLDPGPALTNQRFVTWPDPVLSRIPREPDAALDVTVHNPTAGPLVLQAALARRAPVEGTSAEVPAGATQTVTLTLDAAELDVGRQELVWTLVGPSGGEPFAQGWRLIDVLAPLSLAFEPLRRLNAAAPALPVAITYTGRQPAAATVALEAAGQAVGSARELALQPGQTARVALPLALEPFARGAAVPLAVRLESQGLRLSAACRRPLLPCPRAPEAARVDGDLREWRGREPPVRPAMLRWEYVNPAEAPAETDLSATAWVAHDARGLWLAVEVRDDRLVFPQSRAVWEWDSLQVALDLGSDARPDEGYDANDLEIELGHRPGAAPWCYLGHCPPGWPQEELSARLQGAVQADEQAGFVCYELLVPAEILVPAATLEPDTVLGFSLLVNDNDGQGRAGWLELTPGIGLGKWPAEFAWLWLR